MNLNASTSAEQTTSTDDSLESLGLEGLSLMQLWGAGIESVSGLTKYTAESLRESLWASSDKSKQAGKRIEAAVTDVAEAMKRRQQTLRKPAQIESLAKRARQINGPVGDTSEHELIDVANTAAPAFRDDPLGVLSRDIRKYQVLSREAQIELATRLNEASDEEARTMLISHNLRLVLPIARKHLWSQIEFADLVQEGIIGLITAVERFDHTRGVAFSTHAHWWIRQAISRFVQDYGSVIRVPVHMQELVYKMRLAMNEIALKKGRPPTLNELATALEIEPKKVKQALRVSRMHVGSLDEQVSPGNNTDGDTTLYQLIADEGALRAEHVLEARQELDAACSRVNELAKAVYGDETVSERDCEVFVRFYGLDGSLQKRTLEVTAEKYDLTRERARQIIATIWHKLQQDGYDSDHDDLVAELKRIAALEKLARKSVSVE